MNYSKVKYDDWLLPSSFIYYHPDISESSLAKLTEGVKITDKGERLYSINYFVDLKNQYYRMIDTCHRGYYYFTYYNGMNEYSVAKLLSKEVGGNVRTWSSFIHSRLFSVEDSSIINTRRSKMIEELYYYLVGNGIV